MKLEARRAFTLVELLAGMVLTTLLMLAIFQVLASVARQGRAMEASDRVSIEPWQADLISTIRWDLTNAESQTAEGNELELQGHGSLNRKTLMPRHVPTKVAFMVRQMAGRNWLVRQETTSDNDGWSALICPDVESFEVRSAGGESAEGGELASRYVLRMRFTDGKELTESIVLR